MAAMCSNPLFAKWLKEKWDVAEERSSKGRTTYKKAYDAMVACPITFEHPSEALQLNGLGPKLCDFLLERLKTHNLENGLPPPTLPRKGRKRSATNGGDGDENGSPEPVKKTRKAKPYIPQLRSGPYAIIKALSSLNEGASLTKAHLIDQAQQYCDSSFTVPTNPTKFHTAWNSMKTLIDKDLVDERGRPTRKYSLTDEGWKVARGINLSESGGSGNAVLDLGTRDEDEHPPTSRTKAPKATAKKPTQKLPIPTQDSTSPKAFPGAATGQSHFDLDELSFRQPVSCSTTTDEYSRTSMNDRNDKYGVKAARIARGLERVPEPSNLFIISSSPPPPEAEPQNPARPNTVHNPTESPPPPQRSKKSPFTIDPSNSLKINNPTPSLQNTKPLPEITPTLLAAGTFTVKLILDCREVRSKSDREYIQDELAGLGAKPLLRSLELGDAMWVAEVHDPAVLKGYGEDGNEVVLDWIVERKRLDDLVGSIKDGRFREQKFRLAKSGMRNVIYIIEDFNLGPDTISKYAEAIDSAIASTQVVNGFFVKRTAKLDDTIRYLARMTHLLKSIYEGKPLTILPSHILTPTTHLPLLTRLRKEQPHLSYHLTYSTFSSLSSKSETLSLRDVFLKMLMCMHGITGEKALAIQRVWKTPKEFVAAFESCGSDEDAKKSLLESRVGGPVRTRKISRMLSAKVAEVWADVHLGP